MQLYDEFNDKFCEINDNLGIVYSYNDLYDLEKAEREKEIKLLREAIEKQSKEIEELKRYEEGYKLLSYSLDNYTSNDKIKAKIEPKLKELDEQINEEWKKYGNSKELQDMEDMYNFLQSLLEKE